MTFHCSWHYSPKKVDTVWSHMTSFYVIIQWKLFCLRQDVEEDHQMTDGLHHRMDRTLAVWNKTTHIDKDKKMEKLLHSTPYGHYTPRKNGDSWRPALISRRYMRYITLTKMLPSSNIHIMNIFALICSHNTISTLCGNTAYCAKLSSEDSSRYSNKIESIGLRKCQYYHCLYAK